MTRTWVDALREAVSDLALWLAGLDWLTSSAAVLTLGCLGAAILDSYTSLCVVGGDLGHIGSASACPDFGGWDTRVFPLAVDMGWGGALCAVLRLARTIGLRSWRWWVVLVFEVVTAAFTVVGNAFHGAVLDGATADLHGPLMVVISSAASSVPGVVAVGSGFTLSVLISTRRDEVPEPVIVAAPAEPQAAAQAALSAPGARLGRLAAGEVLALVRTARERLARELARQPTDEELAARLTADGHAITASRVRWYLAQLRRSEREQGAGAEVVAWHTR